MDTGYRASCCRRYHGAAYCPHRFSLFTWASACCCTGSSVKKRFPSPHAWEPLYIKGKERFSLYHFITKFIFDSFKNKKQCTQRRRDTEGQVTIESFAPFFFLFL